MPQYELSEVGSTVVMLDDISLEEETLWRPLDEARVSEIEQNILEGNWGASPIEFPCVIGKSNGDCFSAKACQPFILGWCRGGACIMP